MTDAHRHEVLVVGGGPAGAATAYWLARAGRDVVVIERKQFPREKTCGDGLTPRAVHQLEEMGLGEALTKFHRYDGLRAIAHGISLELQWPEHPVYPSYGYVVRRRDLDQMVAAQAVAAGATLREGTEATTPIVEGGLVQGAVVKSRSDGTSSEIRARYIVVADGANSRFGRALGTSRNRSFPQGMAIRGYYESPLHAEPWIESALDVRDRNGASLPGYGWIFPVGDGTINVGIGLLSTFRDWKSVNTSRLMEEFAATAPTYWGISEATSCGPPTGGRLPMGGSVSPNVGPTWVLVGDAAGTINPFNGEGIDYAYETGRTAAGLLDEALTTGNGMALQRYPHLLEAEYGLYFKVARLFAKVIGNPALLRELTRVGMQSRSLMEWVLRIMANLLRPDELGPAEAAYKAVAALVRVVPESGAA
jgi:geranylgeranyl reductase family protein